MEKFTWNYLIKNKYLVAFFLMLSFSNQAQDIKEYIYNSKYGHIYKEYRESSKEDFIYKCKNRGFTESVSNFFEHITNVPTVNTEGFAYSYVTMNDKYGKFLRDLVNEASKNQYKLPRSYAAGSKCNETYYNFIQFYLEKFEILIKHEADLNKFNMVYRKKMIDEKENKVKLLKDSFDIEASKIYDIKENDNELANLLNQKKLINLEKNTEISNKINKNEILLKNKLSLINQNYQEEYSILDNEKKKKIKSLPVENYASNKRKIQEDYEPKFSLLKLERNKKINQAKKNTEDLKVSIKNFGSTEFKAQNNSLNKKILDRKTLLEEETNKKINALNISKKEKIKDINNYISKKYNLESTKKKIIENHKSLIDSVNAKIENLFGKKKVKKKGLNSLFKF